MRMLDFLERKFLVFDKYSSVRKLSILSLLLLVTTVAVYWQVGSHPFISLDELDHVTGNPHVESGLSAKNIIWAFTNVEAFNWHPITWLSHITIAHLYGMDPRAHHVANMLLHAVSSVFLFLLLSRLTGAVWKALFVAALFALHPLHVESVAWVAERKDVLSALFWFLTLYLYCEYARKNLKPSLYALSFASFLLGLMCKSMLVTLPVVMLLLDFWPLGRFGHEGTGVTLRKGAGQATALIKEKIPFFLASLLIGVITIYAQHQGGTTKGLDVVPLALRAQNAVVAYAKYVVMTFWPIDLSVLYPIPAAFPIWQVALSVIALLLVSLAAFRTAKSRPYLLAGWLWFLVTLLPVIGLIQVGNQAMADRYSYIPMTGLLMMVAWGIPALTQGFRHQKSFLALLAGAVVITSGTLAWRQLGYWAGNTTLFAHALETTTDNYLIHDMMGSVLIKERKLDAAITEFRTALRIMPDFGGAHYNLGVALVERGDLDAAIVEYREALRLMPTSSESHYNLAVALGNKGNLDAAMQEYKAALSLDPADGKSHYNLGRALAQKGYLDAAIEEFRAAVRIDPDDVSARNNLGMALAGKGAIDAAIREYEAVLAAKPDNLDAHNNLGVALVSTGKLDAAIREFNQALRVNPLDIDAHSNLGVVLAKKGDLDSAINEFRAVLRLSPNDPYAVKNLGRALADKKTKGNS